MKNLLILFLTACLLIPSEVCFSNTDLRSNVSFSKAIVSESEPEYYKLPSGVELTDTEYQTMKKILAKSVSFYNKKAKVGAGASLRYFQIGPLTSYGIQYRVTLTKHGEKEVWINGFCKGSDGMYQKEQLTLEPVVVFDGGSCYFNTIISLKKRKASDIIIHGLA